MIKLKDLLKLTEKKLSPAEAKKAHKKFKETGEVPPHIKKLLKKIKNFEKKNPELSFEVEDVVVPGLEWMADIKEGKLTEEDVKISDLWKEYVKKYGKDKAAEKLMDILTGGTWAAWDGDKIKDFKKKLIKKFSKYMREGKLSEKINKSKVDKSFYRVIAFVRKEAKKLNDDDLYAMTQKLAKWFK